MAQKCAKCGSADTTTGLDRFTCLMCGASSFYDETRNKPPKKT